MNPEDYAALEKEHMSGGMARRPAVIVRGEGARIVDASGKEYLDLSGAHGWASVGHCHPEITKAIAGQAARLVMHTENGYNDQRALWFRDLSALLEREVGSTEKGPLTRIHPCNSGAEAVEGAVKAARYFTGRPGIVAAKRAFHGRTLGALSATWKPHYREPFLPLVPGFSHVPFNDASALEEAVTEKTAALLLEVVQGEGGVHPATPEFLDAARRICDEKGALLVFDEIQTGMGRTGKWFACGHYRARPDILLLGKALGGGIPMGAVCWRREIGTFEAGRHASTFGGGPLPCAASRAVLEVMEKEDLPGRAARLGAKALERLEKEKPPKVREVRGIGLMIGLELKVKVNPILRALMEKGVWALPAGPTVLRLLPPLVITEEELDRALDLILEVLHG